MPRSKRKPGKKNIYHVMMRRDKLGEFVMKKLICSVMIMLLLFSLAACSNFDEEAEADKTNVESEELIPTGPDEPEAEVVEEQTVMQDLVIDENGFVWRVAPELEYELIYRCLCGFYSYELWNVPDPPPGIDTKTGLIGDEMHGGHGGGAALYLYDEGRNLYGYYGHDEGGEFFEMWPEDDFLLHHNWFADVLKTFQKIDSSLVKSEKIEYGTNEWDFFTEYDLSDAFIDEKHAIALGTTFVSDFIYDQFDRYSDYPYFNGSPLYLYGFSPNYIAVRLDGEWGIIDKDGNTAVPFRFEDILIIDEETAFAKINGRYGILDVNKTAESIGERTLDD